MKLSERPLNVAMMLALPAATGVTMPVLAPIVVTAGSDELQAAPGTRFRVEPSL
jgi:hypothetical protein